MTRLNNFSCLRTALKGVVKDNAALTWGLAAVIAADIVLALVPPLVLEKIINLLTGGSGVALGLALLYFLFIALSGVFDSAQAVLITVFGQKMTHRLRGDMCRKLTRMPAGYFTNNDAGATASRFVGDVDTVQTLFDDGIVSMFADACKVVSIIAVIFTRSVGLGLLLLVVTPLLMWLTMAYRRWMLSSQLRTRASAARVTNHVPETIRCIRMIHAFGIEKYMEKRYEEYIKDNYRSKEKSNLYDSTYSPIIIFTGSAVIAVMMVMSAMGGGMREFFGMSVGTAVAVIAYVGKVFTPLEGIGMEIENIQAAAAGAHRVDEFMSAPEREMPDAPAPSAADDAVRVRDVCFGYGDGNVLDNLSFDAKRGESVTLCGRTGAGKTTIFRLLLGLYAPQSGTVSIFGAPAGKIRDADKRKLFGYVEQSFRKVPGTVGEQITLSDPGIDRDAMERAAKLVELDGYISSLPGGYDTPFSETLFSQGQLQLLSIARAVAADPEILLLDEITANLDSGTEEAVTAALDRASENRTVLAISHRLNTETERGRLVRI